MNLILPNIKLFCYPSKKSFFTLAFLFLISLSQGCCPAPIIMTNDAFRAEITIINAPSVMETAEKRRVDLKVKNISSRVWQTRGSEPNWLTRNDGEGGKYRVTIGNHWLDNNQKIIINDDGRASLQDNIKPGESVNVSLSITAPAEPGIYTLELDLVQENVAWFALKGSQTAHCRIKVE